MDIEEIYRVAMQSCHGTIFALRVDNPVVGDRKLEATISRIHRVNKSNPLVVFCTGYDRAKDWNPDDTRELSKMVYRDEDLSESRFHFCSPPLYRSAQWMKEELKSAMSDNDNSKLDFTTMTQSEGGGVVRVSLLFIYSFDLCIVHANRVWGQPRPDDVGNGRQRQIGPFIRYIH